MRTRSLLELETRDSRTGFWNAIIEAPAGSRNKYKYDPEEDLFTLHKVLPAGAAFPYDFGFLPSTLGDDGDPLDILVFCDAPVYPGTRVPVRLIGVIEATQTQAGTTLRNDRFLGVAAVCQDYQKVQELTDLDRTVLVQLEHFFISYNEMANKIFAPQHRRGSRPAEELVEAGRERFRQQARPIRP